jgi:hypothetical protein
MESRKGELMKVFKLVTIAALAMTAVACGKGKTTYSLLADGSTFNQSSATINNKIDVLWIVDNSGSMLSSQQNLAANFPAFINKFTEKAYDFQIAVNSTDAYLAQSPLWNSYYAMNPKPVYYEGGTQAEKAKFRDGVGTTHSGFFVLTPSTPNLHQNFITNAMLGTNGRGDERSFQSMEASLTSSLNSGFIRQGGHLAVILLTDEDDFSNATTTAYNSYVPELTPISYYVSFLDAITGSAPNDKKYSVNTISVPDQACLNQIFNGAQKIGNRVRALADATGGKKGSICGNFSDELAAIAAQIVQLSTKFSLGNKKPIPASIVVSVNGAVVTDWTYESSSNSIVFINGYAPPQGSVINVTFDPESISF